MLTIIDRYISKVFVGYFLAGLVIFVTIFLAVDFMTSLAQNEVEISVLAKYYQFYLPEVVHQLFPVACLLATIFTLSSLNKTNELTALFSVGMSLARVSAPILMIISILSVLFFWVGDRVLPHFAQKKNYVFFVEIKRKPSLYSTVKTDKIWYRSENVLFNIQTLNPRESKAQGLTLYYFNSDWKLIQLIKAKSVVFEGNRWNLYDGLVTLFPEESSFPLTKGFTNKVVSMGEDLSDIQSTSSSSNVMSMGELKKFIAHNKAAGLDTLSYEVDYHGKIGFALAGFVMSLLGIPFSISRQRAGGGAVNVGLCIGFAFLYWILFSSSLALGRHNVIPPIVAAWGPNVLMAGLAVFFLLRLKK